MLSHARRDGDRGRAWVGTQSQVRAHDITIAGHSIEQFDHMFDNARSSVAGAAVTTIEYIGVVKGSDIDVAGIVQLMCAHFAKCDKEQAFV